MAEIRLCTEIPPARPPVNLYKNSYKFGTKCSIAKYEAFMKAVAQDTLHIVKSTMRIDASGYFIFNSSATASAALTCPEPIEAATIRKLFPCIPCSPKSHSSLYSSISPRRVQRAPENQAVIPPSTLQAAPVTNEAAGEARKTMTAAASSAVPMRPKG